MEHNYYEGQRLIKISLSNYIRKVAVLSLGYFRLPLIQYRRMSMEGISSGDYDKQWAEWAKGFGDASPKTILDHIQFAIRDIIIGFIFLIPSGLWMGSVNWNQSEAQLLSEFHKNIFFVITTFISAGLLLGWIPFIGKYLKLGLLIGFVLFLGTYLF